jgi:Starch-binding associating with outer membrane
MILLKKITHKAATIVGFAALLTTTSCGDIADFGDINVNPNSVTDPLTSALLTNAEVRMGTIGNTQSVRSLAIWYPGLYCQYFSQSQYTDESTYSTVAPGWDDIYAGPLKDLQTIIDFNSDDATKAKAAVNGSNSNQIAVARILKVYFYSHTTDLWGDLPYSQALNGEKTVQPVYDSQQDVYKGMFKELKEAVAQFDGGNAVVGDKIFGGNATKWKKFANSLRLILALRISKGDATLGAAEFKEALAGGVIETNADNVILTYPGGTYNHPWYDEYNGRNDFSISQTIEKALKDINDPRLPKYGTPSASGAVVGIPYGVTRADAIAFTTANPSYSKVLAVDLRKNNSPYDILIAADVFLARAEAAKRGWTTEVAATMYNNGIKVAFEKWGVFVQADYDAYIANAKVKLAGDADDLKKIGTQRWLTFYPRGDQGWAEWRRTGFPALSPSPAAINSSKQIPRRYSYPSTEPNLNGENYKAAVSKINGGDNADGKVWWDK